MECITTWGKAGTPRTSKEEKTQLGCPSFRDNWNVPKRFKHKPADQPILLAIHQDLWLSVWLHKRTRCCHCQWKCYRPLKSICAANRRDQCYRHQLLDDLHPNVSTCAAVCWFLRIWPYAAYFSKNDLTTLLKTQNWIRTHAWTLQTYHISSQYIIVYHISVCCIHASPPQPYQFIKQELFWYDEEFRYRAPVQSLILTQAVGVLKPHANWTEVLNIFWTWHIFR